MVSKRNNETMEEYKLRQKLYSQQWHNKNKTKKKPVKVNEGTALKILRPRVEREWPWCPNCRVSRTNPDEWAKWRLNGSKEKVKRKAPACGECFTVLRWSTAGIKLSKRNYERRRITMTSKKHVESLLETFPEARNNDFYLCWMWLEQFYGMSLPRLSEQQLKELSGKFSTLTRMRRRIQSKDGKYLPDDKDIDYRRVGYSDVHKRE